MQVQMILPPEDPPELPGEGSREGFNGNPCHKIDIKLGPKAGDSFGQSKDPLEGPRVVQAQWRYAGQGTSGGRCPKDVSC